MTGSEEPDAECRRKKHSQSAAKWRDTYPWLILLDAFRVSIGMQVLILASLGAVATTAGWRLSAKCFVARAELAAPVSLGAVSSGDTISSGSTAKASPGDRSVEGAEEVQAAPAQSLNLIADHDFLSKWPGQRTIPGLPPTVPESVRDSLSVPLSRVPSNPLIALPTRLIVPLLRIFNWNSTWSEFYYYAFGGFWSLLVWSAMGTALARITLVQLGREDRIEVSSALRFAQAKAPSVIGATLMPILGIGIMAVPIAALGLFMRIGIGTFVAGLLWPLVLAAAGMMAMMLLGLLFGWPMVNVAIAAEGSDAFDGLSRSYAYTFQRPMRYLGYCLVASVVGLLGWLLVCGFSEGVIALAYWSATWGLGREQVSAVATNVDQLTGLTWVGAKVIRFWVAAVRTLASGYGYSFFWCAMSAIYLLLRFDIDATEWDDVYDDRHQNGIVFGLPTQNDSDVMNNGS